MTPYALAGLTLRKYARNIAIVARNAVLSLCIFTPQTHMQMSFVALS